MPYYIYQKLNKRGAWECLERHHDFQAASKATKTHKKTALKSVNRDMLITMVQGDTEDVARTVLENRTDKTT
jgi:coproporphyrinogen III oxidase-like Fe-S oxidoreductase